MDGILLAFLGACVVPVFAFADRHTQVGLLDTAKKLLIEPVLKRIGRLHDRLGIRVFGLQVLDDLRVLLLSEPVVVIHERLAVQFGDPGDLLRDRRLQPTRLALHQCGQREDSQGGERETEAATHE
jgi:hypothetical protein